MGIAFRTSASRGTGRRETALHARGRPARTKRPGKATIDDQCALTPFRLLPWGAVGASPDTGISAFKAFLLLGV